MIQEDAFFQPDFLDQVFLDSIEQMGELAEIWDLKNEARLSFACEKTGIQESFCLRTERRARLMANYLIDEVGELNRQALDFLISCIEKQGYIAYPSGLCDSVAVEHFLFILKKMQNENFYSQIHKMHGPLCHSLAEDLVRACLGIFSVQHVTDAHIRRAICSALLGCLRQNVGSCFATAPAIVIQQRQPEHLLADLYEILSTGKLIRTFGGVEFSVPLSPSSGAGDLNKVIALSRMGQELFDSPGLMAAFTAAEVNLEKIWQCAGPFLLEKEMSLADFIHKVLLAYFGLQDEDLQVHKKIEASLAKTQSLMGSVAGHQTKEKWKACEQMHLAEKRAHMAFKALVENALVKTWEFTLASFSEVKMEFSSWNLYTSLGMHPEEVGGIGQVLYRSFDTKLKQHNEKIAEYQAEYEAAYNQLRAAEALLKRASSESEARRLSAEFNSRLYHMQSCLDVRDRAQAQAEKYSEFFSYLMKQYNEKFQEYFQEIYDADMREVKPDIYEDSPAGFRLVYKHGRSNASLWTMIYNEQDYIEMLVQFFLATEPQLAADFDWDLARTVLADVTTMVINHLRSQEFLDTALSRMAKAHGNGSRKKPWAYTSGGTMTTLLKTYYRRETELTEESRLVENETDLLIFILDVLKTNPLITEEAIFTKHPSLLMSSPTHAFILDPSFELLQKGWQDDTFTYSWVRDWVIHPGRAFYEKQVLTPIEQRFLLQELEKKIGLSGLEQLNLHGSVTPEAFRRHLAKTIPLADAIDSLLFEMLPLSSGVQWKSAVLKLLDGLNLSNLTQVLEQFPDFSLQVLSAKQVKDYAKAIYILCVGTPLLSFDLHSHIAKNASIHGLCPPAPVLFADTNWINNYFGFVVNPGTLQLELWRLDKTGSKASPMSAWKPYLTGSSKKTWNIYPRFTEYQ